MRCTKYYAGSVQSVAGTDVKVKFVNDREETVKRCYVKKRARWAARPQAVTTFGGDSTITREFHDFAATRARSARDRREQERRAAAAKEKAEKVKKEPVEEDKHMIAGEALVAEDVLKQLGAHALIELTDKGPKQQGEKWTTCDSSTGDGVRMFLQFIVHPNSGPVAPQRLPHRQPSADTLFSCPGDFVGLD